MCEIDVLPGLPESCRCSEVEVAGANVAGQHAELFTCQACSQELFGRFGKAASTEMLRAACNCHYSCP